jgi:hypothetical protein
MPARTTTTRPDHLAPTESLDGPRRADRRRSRRGRRHVRLPTPRALLGAALITLAAAGVLVSTRPSGGADTRWVVATRDVPAGTSLSADDLGTVAIELPDGVVAVPGADAERLVGRVTRTDLATLSVLRPDDVWERRPLARDGVEVPITVDIGRLPAGLRPGATVDVLASDTAGSGTSVVAASVTILGIDHRPDASLGGTDDVPLRVAVPQDSVATLVDASVRAELTVVLPTATQPGA